MTIILFCLIQSCIVIQSFGLVRRSSSSRIRADVSLRSSRNTVVDKGTCLPSMSRRSEGNQRLFFLVAASVKGHSQLNTFPMVHLRLRLKPACGSAEWRKSHRRNQRGRKESGTLFNIKKHRFNSQPIRSRRPSLSPPPGNMAWSGFDPRQARSGSIATENSPSAQLQPGKRLAAPAASI